MVNALFSSQQYGTKCFQLKGVEFGWQTITTCTKESVEKKRWTGTNGTSSMGGTCPEGFMDQVERPSCQNHAGIYVHNSSNAWKSLQS